MEILISFIEKLKVMQKFILLLSLLSCNNVAVAAVAADANGIAQPRLGRRALALAGTIPFIAGAVLPLLGHDSLITTSRGPWADLPQCLNLT